MSRRTTVFVLAGLVVTLVLAFGVSRFASSSPDGLERVAAEEGLDSGELDHHIADSPLADYETRGIDDSGTSVGVAGVVGVVTVFAVAAGITWAASNLRRRDLHPS